MPQATPAPVRCRECARPRDSLEAAVSWFDALPETITVVELGRWRLEELAGHLRAAAQALQHVYHGHGVMGSLLLLTYNRYRP